MRVARRARARSRASSRLTRRGHRRRRARDARRRRRSSRSSTRRARSTSPTRSPGLARFRVNAFRQRGSISIVCRAIPVDIRTIEELDLPPVITRARRGGARHRPGHRHDRLGQVDDAGGDDRPHQRDARASTSSRSRTRSSSCTATSARSINQREVGMDTGVLQARAAPRPAPGPGRDPDRRDARRGDGPHRAVARPRPATSCSRRSTPSTPTETINRIIDFFPPHQQQQARAMIAGTLKGVVSQRLVPTADGDGRVAVLRDPAHDRPRARHDHRPDADRQARRGHRRGRRTTACRPSTRRCSSTSRPAGSRWRTRCSAAIQPARLQAARRRRRPPRHDDGRPRGWRRPHGRRSGNGRRRSCAAAP